MANMDNTIEATIIATEFEIDPAAPASGPGAGDSEGLRSWAEATAAAKTKRKEKNFIAEDDDAIGKLWYFLEFVVEKGGGSIYKITRSVWGPQITWTGGGMRNRYADAVPNHIIGMSRSYDVSVMYVCAVFSFVKVN
ncbi:hypothetical protein KIW84_055770 [Lathyrus oleraceus]|uniref:Uncharacterized protein n=1 Tax=Pisum sativum TaxID=3888 RepID=A0A9D4WYU3_PEA|nr:hypothetical protein KIW84_055770 [Pisum sativum]